jgi:adenylate cyclase
VRLQIRTTVEGEERTVPLAGDEVRVGRGVDNEVVLPDPSVSRRHAVLRREGDRWEVADLGSTNGVLLNRSRVQHAGVRAGDVLRIGAFDLMVEAAVGAAGAAQPVGAPTSTVVRPLAEIKAALGLAGADTRPPEAEARPGVDPRRPRAEPASGAERERTRADSGADPKRHLLDQAYDNRVVGYLTRLAGLLLTADGVDQILERVTDIAFEALPVDRGFILLLDEAGEPVCELARSGGRVLRRPREEVPVSRTMLAQVMRERVALITLDAQADQRLSSGESIRLHQIRSAMCVPLWSGGDRIIGVMQVDSPYRTGTFTERDLEFLTALANYAAVAVERVRYARRIELEQRLRARLERYHSPAVIEAVIRHDEAGELARLAPAEVTVLFADLVGFTAVAEAAEPAAVAELLQGFFDTAVEAIFAVGGTLDKFIGDCVMAFFGAPVPQADHARRAVAAAIDIRRGLADWNARHAEGELPLLSARIALHSGPVVVGEVGSSRRVDYTVLGNTVNVAARLAEQVASSGEIVLGGETARLLSGEVPCEPLGEVQLRGLKQKVAAFRLHEPDRDPRQGSG